MKRYLRPIEDAQELVFAGVQARQEPVEGGEAGFAGEDAIEPGPQLGGPASTGIVLVDLEILVKPPDQLAGDVERLPLLIIEADQLMHQALSVDPAERMIGQTELAGAVRDDDGVSQEAMCPDAAEQRLIAFRDQQWQS